MRIISLLPSQDEIHCLRHYKEKMHSYCSFSPIFTQRKAGILFKFFKREDAYWSGVDKIWPASLAKPQEQNEKSAHFFS